MRLPRGRPQETMGLLGPDSIELFPRRMQVQDQFVETLCVTGYPREVGPGWLTPLLGHRGNVDVALHVEPIRNEIAAGHLRRQIARLESSRRIDASKARVADPELEAAAGDAIELAASVARGEGRLFRVGLYITIRADSPEALEEEKLRVRAISASLLLDTRQLPFRQLEGWLSTLPIASDHVRLSRTFDTGALASCFPFASAEIGSGSGIFYGRNATTGSPILFDRFGLENFNQVVMARSGAGKSYFAKLTLLRSLYLGIEALVIDPENEYERLALAAGGRVISLGGEAFRLNPLDLGDPGSSDAVIQQSLFIHTVIESMVGRMSPEERSVLDRALINTYQRAGITADPSTHSRPAPLLRDVVAELMELPEGGPLADRLQLFVAGSHKTMFDGPTTARHDDHLVVFALRDLPEELKAVGTLLALHSIWRTVTRGSRKPRIVLVDEAWWLLREESRMGAAFLNRLAKSSRKHWCGLTTITQDVADVLSTDLGQAVITNASSHVLLGQSPQAADSLAKAFDLSDGEVSYLLSCDRGEGLLSIGTERAPLRIIASPREHQIATSDPAELEAMEPKL